MTFFTWLPATNSMTLTDYNQQLVKTEMYDNLRIRTCDRGDRVVIGLTDEHVKSIDRRPRLVFIFSHSWYYIFEIKITRMKSHSSNGKSQATHIDCKGTRFGWCIPNQTYPPWSPLGLDHLLDSTIHLSFQVLLSTFWHDSFLNCVQFHAQRYWLVLVARF